VSSRPDGGCATRDVSVLIVDAQVHIWAADSPERPWPARHAPQRATPLSAHELLGHMDRAGVAAAVLVPPSWEGERNDLVAGAAAAWPGRFAAMGRLDPEAPDLDDAVARWRAMPGAAGLRFSLHRPGMAEALGSAAMQRVWHAAETHDVPVALLLPQSRMHHVRAIAERFPRLRILLDHLGVPSTVPAAERFASLAALLSLARYDTIAVKASALPSIATDGYPYRSLHEPLRRVVDAFGPRRVFWGTDFSRLTCSYAQAIAMVTDEIDWLDDAGKEWIMGRGIAEWLRLDRILATSTTPTGGAST
jgi:predicted TIM-barrel fold metal-dependent hydrolase